MNIEDIIRDIRKRCRLAMNGVVSSSMRERGVAYKLNFGVSLAQIKGIAANYEPNDCLAEKLWDEDVRELKILATLLYPTHKLNEETANRWMKQIPNQEIREQVCLNLFSRSDYSDRLVQNWASSEVGEERNTAYWLLARLLLQKNAKVLTDVDVYAHIFVDLKSNDTFLRNSALQALKNLGRTSRLVANNIIDNLSQFRDSEDALEREIYESLKFEFDFYFE